MLNGSAPTAGSTAELFKEYFDWQHSLPRTSEDRKADNTLKVNAGEANHILRVFGRVAPSAIKPCHIYRYLMGRATEGAPAKANKESGRELYRTVFRLRALAATVDAVFESSERALAKTAAEQARPPTAH